MSKNKNMTVQKPDKGNTVVILDKCSSITVVQKILNDNVRFSKFEIPTGKEINNINNLKKTK